MATVSIWLTRPPRTTILAAITASFTSVELSIIVTLPIRRFSAHRLSGSPASAIVHHGKRFYTCVNRARRQYQAVICALIRSQVCRKIDHRFAVITGNAHYTRNIFNCALARLCAASCSPDRACSCFSATKHLASLWLKGYHRQ
jgi:hypothetical protein